MPLQRLDAITVHRSGDTRRVELYQGDLTDLGDDQAVDVLVVSAYPNDYSPVPGTLVAALLDRGVSVADLARRKAFDLRHSFSCWLSEEIAPEKRVPGIRFKRVLCFEPHWRGRLRHPAQAVEELYLALTPFMSGSLGLTTVAMPLLATGSIGAAVRDMVEPMIDGALRWMRGDTPLRTVRIACYTAADAAEAREVFDRLKTRYARHDVFVSYCHQDAARVVPFCERLRQRIPGLRLFRDADNLKPGMSWRDELIRAVQSSAFFVPFYSPAYLSSGMCLTEFYMALMAHEQTGAPLFFPVMLEDARLTKSMAALHYEDGRPGQDDKLDRALERLTGRLLG
jgi:hypothetical protein